MADDILFLIVCSGVFFVLALGAAWSQDKKDDAYHDAKGDLFYRKMARKKATPKQDRMTAERMRKSGRMTK